MSDANGPTHPVTAGPSPRGGGISGRQAFLAIALVFFLGVLIGVGIGLAL
jgi:hypothetical protein